MAQQEVVLRALGYMTQGNRLNGPEGGMSVATNIDLERPNVARPRRGFAEQTITDADRIHKIIPFGGTVLAHWDEAGTYRLSYLDPSTTSWIALSGIHEPPSNVRRMRHAQVAGCLALTSRLGILRLDSGTGMPVFAGAPKGIGFDPENSSASDDPSGILEPQRQVAYRYCLSTRDGLGRLIRGSPSGRLIVQNTNSSGGNNKKPTVRVLLPMQNGTESTPLGESYVLSVYRTSQSVDLSTEPLEDYALIYEANLTSTDIVNGYVDVTDVTPDALRGSALPENPTINGILSANEPPPFAYEVVSWKGCLVGFNIRLRERIEFRILAVGGSEGIQDGDTLVISRDTATVTVTAKTAPSSPDEYRLENTGSASLDIMLTAQNLCAAINRHSSNTLVYAYYLGNPLDPRSLGHILLEDRTAAEFPFSLFTGSGSKSLCFEPAITEVGLTSETDAWGDGWFISKPSQPDSVPLPNLNRLGTGEEIVAAAALDESLFIFTDSNIYRMTGEPPLGVGDTGTLRIERVRAAMGCLAPETVCVLAGAVYALTTKGVVAVNDSGVRLVSEPLRPELEGMIQLLAQDAGEDEKDVRWSRWFAVSHESEHRYLLGLTDSDASVQASSLWVYHALVDAWSRWAVDANCGAEHPESRVLYMGTIDDGDNVECRVLVQRSIVDPARYMDGNSGDMGNYPCSLRWLPFTGGNPGLSKHFQEVAAIWENGAPSTSVGFSIVGTHGADTVTAAAQANRSTRVLVPRPARRGNALEVELTITSGNWALSGVALKFDAYSERVSK